MNLNNQEQALIEINRIVAECDFADNYHVEHLGSGFNVIVYDSVNEIVSGAPCYVLGQLRERIPPTADELAEALRKHALKTGTADNPDVYNILRRHDACKNRGELSMFDLMEE